MNQESGEVEKVSAMDDLMKDLGVNTSNRRFAMRAAWYCIVSAFICYTLGYFSGIGLPSPFVREAEVSQLAKNQEEFKRSQDAMTNDLHQDRVERLDARILTLTANRCHAQEGSPARSMYTEQLEEIIRKYKALTGEYPRVPDCREVSMIPEYNEFLPALLADA